MSLVVYKYMIHHKVLGFLYRNILKRIFFKFDPELVHDKMLATGKILARFRLTRAFTSLMFNYENKILEQKIAGLTFRNPVGLSAGFDKNAAAIDIFPSVGFGHMEIGSVTMHSYAGNPKPRLFRLPKSKALVVYFGLKNDGVEKIAPKINSSKQKKSVVGVSVAKTNCDLTATVEGGVKDYVDCLTFLEKNKTGDYYTLNISCPNTFGGEPFTTPETLERLLSEVHKLHIKKPVFVKMPINLPINEFDALLQICEKYKITGVIIGNLTKVRDPKLIKDVIPEHVKGGISGKPTETLNNELISYTYKHYQGKFIIIGVGGIFSAEDAYEKIKRGANLLQLITGMIYQGPQLIAEINTGLVKLLQRDGYKHVAEAVGTYKHSP